MHSSLVRLQNVFGFFTTVSFVVAAVIALSVVITPQTPSASLEMRNVQVVKGRPHYYSTKREEYAHIKFDIEADLTSLFSWNTKQLFVYVTASFPSTTKSKPTTSSSSAAVPYSTAIIWDAIIPSSLEPWHPNTYIHPGTTSKQSAKKAREQRKVSAKDPRSGKKGSKDEESEGPQAYPHGTSEGILKLSNQKPKYQITTPASTLAGLDNCTLELHYNVQPWVGALTWASAGSKGWLPFWSPLKGQRSSAFKLPELKAVEASKSREELGTETGGEANRGSPA